MDQQTACLASASADQDSDNSGWSKVQELRTTQAGHDMAMSQTTSAFNTCFPQDWLPPQQLLQLYAIKFSDNFGSKKDIHNGSS